MPGHGAVMWLFFQVYGWNKRSGFTSFMPLSVLHARRDTTRAPARSSLFNLARFSQRRIKEIRGDCCRQWTVALFLLCWRFSKRRQAGENVLLTRFIILRLGFKLLARSPVRDWSALRGLIHSWKHSALCSSLQWLCVRGDGSSRNIIQELAVEKPPPMGADTGLIQAKVKRTV